ncbi:oxidoreductase [Flavobacterium sp. TAB 87]|uniref:sialidase family protein n=1 Tax=Flavobacterium sp. TAB 87 TaxID=1729581 RepID=UPI00076D3762|nr:oxidoreductase [Flavobacterium sp. TAB 87]KVV14871.1 putative plant photosystem II stability/assembly factor [Flavobacterium sp. TAB 87]
MKKAILFLGLLLVLLSCKSAQLKSVNNNFVSVLIDTLFQDKISIRAIAIDENIIWYSADGNRFGYFDLKSRKKVEKIITEDSLKIEFRSLAQNKQSVFVLSIANPALLYKISKNDLSYRLVYTEKQEKVFYDSMQFWNDTDAIAIGDPIDGTFSILRTGDGGNTWTKLPSEDLPKLVEGEAAFAASNTNIVIKNNKTWLVSGGKNARVFYSDDKAKTWTASETPILQGKTMTGIFTADFYDEKNGFIAGGDYELPQQNFGNKAITSDGGKNWKLIGENQGFGYASCVQYVPNSKGKKLLMVGATGIFYSTDSAKSWKQISSDSKLFTIRFVNETTAIAAGSNKLIRLTIKD